MDELNEQETESSWPDALATEPPFRNGERFVGADGNEYEWSVLGPLKVDPTLGRPRVLGDDPDWQTWRAEREADDRAAPVRRAATARKDALRAAEKELGELRPQGVGRPNSEPGAKEAELIARISQLKAEVKQDDELILPFAHLSDEELSGAVSDAKVAVEDLDEQLGQLSPTSQEKRARNRQQREATFRDFALKQGESRRRQVAAGIAELQAAVEGNRQLEAEWQAKLGLARAALDRAKAEAAEPRLSYEEAHRRQRAVESAAANYDQAVKDYRLSRGWRTPGL